MILELLGAAILLGIMSGGDHKENNAKKSNSRFEREREYSLFDYDGVEHVVDEDGYCEDCDDYHEDW